MTISKTYALEDCSLARALEVVGERWTLLVLREVFLGVRRFTDIRVRLGVPRAVLSDRLSSLVAEGLLERRPYQPGREEYVPTQQAVDVWPAMHALIRWSDEHRPAPDGPRRIFLHAECETRLDAEGRCPTCAVRPALDDVVTNVGPGRDPLRRRTDPVSLRLSGSRRMLTPVTD